jgi:hypothetical protein
MEYNTPITVLYEVLPRKMADELWLLFGDFNDIYAADEKQFKCIVKGLLLSLYAPQPNVEIMTECLGCMFLYEFGGVEGELILNVSVDEFDDKRPSDDFIDMIFSKLLDFIDQKQRLENEKLDNEFEERLRTDPSLENYANSC